MSILSTALAAHAAEWPEPDDPSPASILKRALLSGRLCARASASGTCPTCDPGGEGVEIGHEVMAAIDQALELLPTLRIEAS